MDENMFKINFNSDGSDPSNLPINEEGEFAPHDYGHTGANNGVKSASVSVPGGTGETPSAKPEGGEKSISVPGGTGEHPSVKHSEFGPSIPKGTELTTDEWKKAMSALQRSFKEGYELMGMLESCKIVEKSTDQKQEEFLEEAIGNAILEAYENGPIFEAVDRSDKHDVKKIVQSLRGKMKDALSDQDCKYYNTSLVSKALIAGATALGAGAIAALSGVALAGAGVGAAAVAAGAATGAATGAVSAGATGLAVAGTAGAAVGGVAGSLSAAGLADAFSKMWKNRLWQVLGMTYVEDGNIQSVTNSLNEKFKEQLGDYKILYVRSMKNLADQFRTKFGWKNNRNAYFLIVDKKIPADIKKAFDQMNKALSEENKGNDGDNKKDENIKESKETNYSGDDECEDGTCGECSKCKEKAKKEKDKKKDDNNKD